MVSSALSYSGIPDSYTVLKHISIQGLGCSQLPSGNVTGSSNQTTAKMVAEDLSVMVMRIIIRINSRAISHTFHLHKTQL